MSNLCHLQTTMSINDMADATEALDVALSWQQAAQLNVQDAKPGARKRK